MFHEHSRFIRLALAVAALGWGLGCGASDMPRGARQPPGTGVPGAGSGAFAGSGGVPGTVGGGGTFGNPTGPPPNVGASGSASMPVCLEATVAFVVDGSGSMCEVFGASTRWQELRKALVDPTAGLIYRLQSQARFGMSIYDGSIDIGLAGMATGGSPTPACAGGGSAGRLDANECMQLVEVPPRKGNADAIAQMFPNRELGGSTPTDLAMNKVVDDLIALQPGLDLAKNPQYIILATDGQPNSICVGGTGGDGVAQQQGVLAAVDKAAAARITTFVISLAGGDAALEAHLAEVARRGNPADPAAHPFSPANPEELVMALIQLLGTALNCNVE
jgi:hypothetical protein